jgi:hypothetical protein
MSDTDQPYIVWVDYGYEGWHPTGFKTLKEAVEHKSYGSTSVITKKVEFSVTEHE